MNTNIFRNTDITKIYLFYVDGGIKVKTEVKMRFMDQKDGYFSIVGVNYGLSKYS